MAYFMQACGYSVTALVLPFVLGRNLEQSFLISMKYSSDSPLIFFGSTITIVLWGLILLTVFGPWLYSKVAMLQGASTDTVRDGR
jgi:TctA family transporter